jgi:methylated-DNA-[protein]-cysteine S-methyltransferase
VRQAEQTLEALWDLVSAGGAPFQGQVICGVRTTGIYCRPGCPGRPKRENVTFLPSVRAARAAGFRACMRCRPDEFEESGEMTGSVYTTVDSPIGELLLVGDGEVLHGLHMQDAPRPMAVRPEWRRDDGAFPEARRELREYFAGERTEFEVPVEMEGTAFQRTVWSALRAIPYGETRSYGELARSIGSPSAVRAVGLANGRNPIAVIVPCHRVIGADGTLTGYGGGLERKRTLLDLERGPRLAV